MRRCVCIMLGVVVGIAAVGAWVMVSPSAFAGGCPGSVYYGIGGTGDPGSTRVPGIYGPYVPIVYPGDALRGDYSRTIAQDELDADARSLRAACPATRITVVGFSLGASAASIVVDEWQTDPTMSHDTTAIYYGDPRRPDAGGFGGIETAGLPAAPGYTWMGAHQSGPIPQRDICHPADLICTTPVPWTSNLAAVAANFIGYLTGQHNYYGG